MDSFDSSEETPMVAAGDSKQKKVRVVAGARQSNVQENIYDQNKCEEPKISAIFIRTFLQVNSLLLSVIDFHLLYFMVTSKFYV